MSITLSFHKWKHLFPYMEVNDMIEVARMAMNNGGKKLNELLKERGFKIKAVVEASGIAPTTFYRWIDNPSVKELIKVSEFTHIPMEELINCYRTERSDQTDNPSDDN